jgi:hypothetical protein
MNYLFLLEQIAVDEFGLYQRPEVISKARLHIGIG